MSVHKKNIQLNTLNNSQGNVSILLILIVLVGGFVLGHLYGSSVLPFDAPGVRRQINVVNDDPQIETLDMSLFWETIDLINEKFLFDEDIEGEKLLHGAISGMVGSLGDPYTSFYTPDENESFIDSLEGVYEGIGAQLGYNDDNQLVIVAPLEESPAQAAGLKSQDIIIEVDGESTAGWSIPQAVNSIRGDADSVVTLTIFRPSNGEEAFEVEVARDEIQIPAVTSNWLENDGQETKIAHVRVLRFGSDTIQEWNNVVNELVRDGAEGVVLDVRNNPGGYLNAAIYLASEFFENGVVVKRESNNGVQDYTVDHECRLCDVPVTVLINEGSASASEILAGAIQARDRGELIGQKSFGKGTVQDAVDLENGTSLHVTVAKWLMPDNANIHGEGLTPEYEVETEETSGPFGEGAEDAQLQKALNVLLNE